MTQSSDLQSILNDLKEAKVELRSIPVLRKKLFFKVLINRKVKWLIYAVMFYWTFFQLIGFEIFTKEVK